MLGVLPLRLGRCSLLIGRGGRRAVSLRCARCFMAASVCLDPTRPSDKIRVPAAIQSFGFRRSSSQINPEWLDNLLTRRKRDYTVASILGGHGSDCKLVQSVTAYANEHRPEALQPPCFIGCAPTIRRAPQLLLARCRTTDALHLRFRPPSAVPDQRRAAARSSVTQSSSSCR